MTKGLQPPHICRLLEDAGSPEAARQRLIDVAVARVAVRHNGRRGFVVGRAGAWWSADEVLGVLQSHGLRYPADRCSECGPLLAEIRARFAKLTGQL